MDGSCDINKSLDGCSKDEEEGPTTKRLRKGTSVVEQWATFLAKYKQQRMLGEGGYGRVFMGLRRADNFPDQNGEEFSAEVAVMSRLSAERAESGESASVALLDVYDLGLEQVLVMERPDPCQDLLRYLKAHNGLLQEGHAKVIVKQLLAAAAELERHNVFHRDIKLENILIQSEGDALRVRLIDFGVSCFSEPSSLLKTFEGTVTYKPPEFISRGRYAAGPTTVWQLGTVLFELLHQNSVCGTLEFLTQKLRIRKTLSAECRDFLKRCLGIIPEERSTVEQLLRHPWLH
ncbi:serine/threonine-protein kinase pim-1-like [Salarias fasciatus]|uniref:serine/threonine-protein kinase pim-1-like n=1 Tax=Salarias fasciatus TaxID=181472 RepID=UPI0011766833|nr:serine/threonine-protein kinase pim-1-like [Salarias fasciatus]